MPKLTAITITIALAFLLAPAYSKRKSGPWFMIPKGLEPRIISNHSVNQNVILVTPDKNKPEEKLIDARFEFTRKIGPLGALIAVYQRTCGEAAWAITEKINVSSICDRKVPKLRNFWDCFDGQLNEDCTIDPGNYTLKTWNVEKELQTFFNQLEYKCYRVLFCFYDDKEQELRPPKEDKPSCVWVVEVKAQIEDEDYKGKSKRKKKKEEKKGEEKTED